MATTTVPAFRQEGGFQGPTSGRPATRYSELWHIVTHPAFRLGFIDAKNGRSVDHDRIAARIRAEAPESFFTRQDIDPARYEAQREFETAQYRYEEGRLAYLMEGLRCRGWGHPDFPPAQVRSFIWNRADHSPQKEASSTAPLISISQLTGEGLPLFRQQRRI